MPKSSSASRTPRRLEVVKRARGPARGPARRTDSVTSMHRAARLQARGAERVQHAVEEAGRGELDGRDVHGHAQVLGRAVLAQPHARAAGRPAAAPTRRSARSAPSPRRAAMKPEGSRKPRARVLPAQQRLDAEGGRRRRRARSPAGSDSCSSPRAEAPRSSCSVSSSAVDLGAHRGLEELDPGALRRLARYIARSASRISASALVGVGRAHAIPTLAPSETSLPRSVDGFGDRRARALGHVDRLALGAQLLAEDQELVAAETGDRVARAQDRPQAPRRARRAARRRRRARGGR